MPDVDLTQVDLKRSVSRRARPARSHERRVRADRRGRRAQRHLRQRRRSSSPGAPIPSKTEIASASGWSSSSSGHDASPPRRRIASVARHDARRSGQGDRALPRRARSFTGVAGRGPTSSGTSCGENRGAASRHRLLPDVRIAERRRRSPTPSSRTPSCLSDVIDETRFDDTIAGGAAARRADGRSHDGSLTSRSPPMRH